MTQDRIVGNQQRAGVFWERITTHYQENQPQGPRPQRSLETKCGIIKHDVSWAVKELPVNLLQVSKTAMLEQPHLRAIP